jgi:hypothetical protein
MLQLPAQPLDIAPEVQALAVGERIQGREIGVGIDLDHQRACGRELGRSAIIGRRGRTMVGEQQDEAAHIALGLAEAHIAEPAAIDDRRRREHRHGPGGGERHAKQPRPSPHRHAASHALLPPASTTTSASATNGPIAPDAARYRGSQTG